VRGIALTPTQGLVDHLARYSDQETGTSIRDQFSGEVDTCRDLLLCSRTSSPGASERLLAGVFRSPVLGTSGRLANSEEKCELQGGPMHLSPDDVIFWQHGFLKLNSTVVTTWILMLALVVGSRLITRALHWREDFALAEPVRNRR
jgi:hypothetical protein